MTKKPTYMKFNRDMFYTDRDVPLYQANIVYEIPVGMVDRWLKRGGVIVDAPKVESKKQEVDMDYEEPVEVKVKKTEDKPNKPEPRKYSGYKK